MSEDTSNKNCKINNDNNSTFVDYDLYIGVRLHLGKSKQLPSKDQMKIWMTNLESLSHNARISGGDDSDSKIAIAVDASSSGILVKEVEAMVPANVTVIPIHPWGQFVPALNALVSWANTSSNKNNENNGKNSLICFLSMETTSITWKALQHLSQYHNDNDTLVVGPVLTGHDFNASNKDDEEVSSQEELVVSPLMGRTCPWNTCAIWNLTSLSKTGFLQISEQMPNAGIEEVAVVATHQNLFSSSSKAKLVSSSSIAVPWTIQDFSNDPKRKEWHEAKMKSKNLRALFQLEKLFTGKSNVNYGTVHHIASK